MEQFAEFESESESFHVPARKEAVRTHLNGVMGDNKTLPIKVWEKEQKTLVGKKFALCERYYRLQDEARSVEILRKITENLMREDRQERPPTRMQGLEL